MARLLPALMLAAGAAGAASAQECTGDCDAADGVIVNEILRCVAVGLGHVGLAACDACDADGDTEVTVDELVAAVDNALNGCPLLPPPSAVARFALPEGGPLDWGSVPFPSDLYRDASGAVRIGALPVEVEKPLHAAMRDLLQTRDGFCATCNVYFALDGALDPTTLPAGDVADPADAVLLVDVDPSSPERGRLFPLRSEWDATRGRLAIRPRAGIALHRNRRYAALLTTGLRAADGAPLAASDTFRLTRRRGGAATESVAHARAVLAPAFDELERLGIGRTRIVALAAFTTEDVTADVLGARAAVQADPPLEVVIDRRRAGVEIDELLGVPGEDRPGIDLPPASGQAGTRSIVHDALQEVITGRFFAPRVVSGSGTEIGTALRDDSGAIRAGAREAVPFVLTLPRTPAGAPMPVLVAHHGFSASRVTGFASANTAARAGVAVLAIDAYQHGDRAASATDALHAIRGDVPGPDGLAETVALDVTGHVFGVLGAAPGLELFTGYSLGAFLQFAADVSSAVRITRDGSLANALRASGALGVDFDAQRIGFIGNSLGAVVGASVLTAEPDVRFAIQNVAPGSIVETLAQSTEFRPLVDSLFLPILGVTGPFDEVNRHLIFDPLVDLSRWVLEPIDPLALAPYLLRDPVRAGEAPAILFQIAALDEVASTPASESMLTATGTTRVTRYDPAAHGMLEVLNQVSRYEPPAAPPFVLRPTELPVLNPIVAEHAEIAAFLTEHVGPLP
ncbi:MAG: hypothetical protein SF182_25930 [Deltaproteobacteria bacterium]|nr:hypothetical protein [Deltaproteobacteria bacterium]